MSSRLLIIGSSNTDMVIKTDKFPGHGETVLGGKFFMNPGGKGANQAVAAARLGGKVTFITKTGNDIFGKQAIQQFQKEGINIDHVISDKENPSGVALITVDKKGENSIVVAPGANGALTEEDLSKSEGEFINAEILLMQLEIPLETVLYAARKAASHNKKVIINPAPYFTLPKDLFKDLYLITPNETETESLTGIAITDVKSAEKAAKKILEMGVKNAVITMGSQGAYVMNESISVLVPAPKVDPVDTTAAGDVFNGALAVALAEGNNLVNAVEFAVQAAAISVTKMGAQSSAPYRKELINKKYQPDNNIAKSLTK